MQVDGRPRFSQRDQGQQQGRLYHGNVYFLVGQMVELSLERNLVFVGRVDKPYL